MRGEVREIWTRFSTVAQELSLQMGGGHTKMALFDFSAQLPVTPWDLYSSQRLVMGAVWSFSSKSKAGHWSHYNGSWPLEDPSTKGRSRKALFHQSQATDSHKAGSGPAIHKQRWNPTKGWISKAKLNQWRELLSCLFCIRLNSYPHFRHMWYILSPSSPFRAFFPNTTNPYFSSMPHPFSISSYLYLWPLCPFTLFLPI